MRAATYSPDPATALVVAAVTAIAAGAALQVPYTLHPLPDDPSLLAGAVFVAAGLALLLSGAGLALAAMSGRLSVALTRTRALALLPLAAAAFVVVSFLTFDSYYAPDAVRISQNRSEMMLWVAGYALLAIVAAFAAYRRTHGALLLASAVIWLVYPLWVTIHGRSLTAHPGYGSAAPEVRDGLSSRRVAFSDADVLRPSCCALALRTDAAPSDWLHGLRYLSFG